MTDKSINLRERCRFCLCSGDLMPFSEAIKTAFDYEDVVHFTGIVLANDADIAVCNECCASINESKNFRITCLRNDTLFKRLMFLDDSSTKHNITTTSAASTVVVNIDNDIITLEDSDSDDSTSHLGQPVSDDKNDTFSHDGKQSTTEPANTDTYEQSDFGALDGNDSDYSLPSLYDEAIHKPSHDEASQQSLNDKSMVGTEKEKSAERATEDRREKPKTDCTCNSRNKESSTYWPTKKRKRRTKHAYDSDDSIISLYTEWSRKRSSKSLVTVACPVHTTSSRPSSSQISPWRCAKLCDLCGAIVDRMERHMQGAHGGEKTHACPFCPKKFAEAFTLKAHINTWHERSIIFTCAQCGKGFVNQGSYTYHMTNKHKKSDLYECETCHRKQKSWDGYKKHMKEHSLTALKCDDCGKLYKNTIMLEKHKRRYHSS